MLTGFLMTNAHYVSNFYYRIAFQNRERHDSYLHDIEQLSSCREDEWMKDMQRSDWRHQSVKCAVQSIVFSAMCIEAFIFGYAEKHLGGNYTKQHIEKLNIESKFIVVPRLVAGLEINKSGQAYEMMKKLISDRNKIVHFKSSNDLFTNEEYLYGAMNNGLGAIEALMKELECIHPDEKHYFRSIPVMAECFA